MQFSDLITTLGGLHQRLSQQAARQTDQLLTLRNYLFGFYIVEFEQHGTDRAAYNEQLLKRLATELRSQAVKGVSDRSLRQYRQFYLAYPQIWQTASAKFNLPPQTDSMLRLLSELVSLCIFQFTLALD